MSDLVGSKAAVRTFRKLCSKEAHCSNGAIGAHAGMQLLIVSHTVLYRHLAKTRISEEDRFVEIGCSYGHCTALAGCYALGVDHAEEKVQDAQRSYPWCCFVVGDIFSGDLSFLDKDATVLFLDIGGGKNYKPVMKALAISIPFMPKLRLVVVKSIEVSSFLFKFENSAHTVARDLAAFKDDYSEIAEEVAVEIRRRGGELPLSLIHSHLCCGPRLRYLIGKQRMLAFLKEQSPLLQVIEASSGPPEHKVRIRAAPGAMPPPPTSALLHVQAELKTYLRKHLRDGKEFSLIAVFGRVPLKLRRRYVAVAADPELHRQSSDSDFDDRCVEVWSQTWQSSVGLRHFHAFVASSPEFVVLGSSLKKTATMEELRHHLIRWTGEAQDVAVPHNEIVPMVADGKQIILQVLDCNWSTDSEDIPEIQALGVKRAWLLEDGRVLKQLLVHETGEVRDKTLDMNVQAFLPDKMSSDSSGHGEFHTSK